MGDAMLIPGQSYGQATPVFPVSWLPEGELQKPAKSSEASFYSSGEEGHYISTVAETETWLKRQMGGEFRLHIIIH